MTMQPGILPEPPAHARFIELELQPDADVGPALANLARLSVSDSAVIGIGPSVVLAAGGNVPGLRGSPSLVGAGCQVPSTQADLWLWIRGADRGELLHAGRQLVDALASAFRVVRVVDGFKYGTGLDLTGYEDGTENPEGDEALAAAFVPAAEAAGLAGSSFVAVQHWVHDLSHFQSLPPAERDDVIGRRIVDNEEFDEAPESAHVKRSAQESFSPEAFMLRRSMPWTDGERDGLVFVAFGHSFDAFEAVLRRMVGHDDGVVDALFRFSRPVTGSYFWCPPVANGRLDLAALGVTS